VRLHFHTRRDTAAATRCQCAFTLDLHHAGAAVAVAAQAVFETEMRDIDTMTLRGFENAFALKRTESLLVELELDGL